MEWVFLFDWKSRKVPVAASRSLPFDAFEVELLQKGCTASIRAASCNVATTRVQSLEFVLVLIALLMLILIMMLMLHSQRCYSHSD